MGKTSEEVRLEDRSELSANEQSFIVFVPAAMIKCSNKSRQRAKRFILLPSSKVILGGKSRQQAFEAAGSHCFHIQEPDSNACVLLVSVHLR